MPYISHSERSGRQRGLITGRWRGRANQRSTPPSHSAPASTLLWDSRRRQYPHDAYLLGGGAHTVTRADGVARRREVLSWSPTRKSPILRTRFSWPSRRFFSSRGWALPSIS